MTKIATKQSVQSISGHPVYGTIPENTGLYMSITWLNMTIGIYTGQHKTKLDNTGI